MARESGLLILKIGPRAPPSTNTCSTSTAIVLEVIAKRELRANNCTYSFF